MNAFDPRGLRATEPPDRLSYYPSAACLDDQSAIDRIRAIYERAERDALAVLGETHNAQAVFLDLHNEMIDPIAEITRALNDADQALTDKDMGDRWL